MPSRENPQRSRGSTRVAAPDGEAARTRLAEAGGARNQAISSRERPGRRAEPVGPAAFLSRRAADRLRAGHLWVYRSDIERLVPPADGAQLLSVHDSRGLFLGTALYSSSSQIALRIISANRLSEDGWMAVFRERLRSAIHGRIGQTAVDGQTDACRLVFSEADFLPGLIADKYDDVVILQILTQGMDTEAVRAVFLEVVSAELAPRAVFERADPKIQQLELLQVSGEGPIYLRGGESADASAVFHLNGLRFRYDANSGQKTGAFLDQRENYAAAARHCRGAALDVCTYQGGFALHLARVCERVTGIDASRPALEVAEQNLLLNRDQLGAVEVDWIEANAFDLLRDWSDSGRQFDSIVLDPPAFARSKRAAEGALRGYKELNLRALKMLRPGGTLVTCSCSHYVGVEDFTAVVAAAAGDAKRQVRMVERRGAAADHPVLLNVPETEYLKCLICRVD